ncbi:hypothetical protein [Microbacterium sp.]|uniref:hypothetical protein n=1 Tax=Microbacterium sp. TaxID=51671 RepID=UPI0039E3913C
MNRTVRSVATLLAIGFAMYFAARAVWWIEQPAQPLLLVAAILLYLVTVNAAILWDAAVNVRMPLWVAIAAAVSSVVVQSLATHSLALEQRTAPFATWYIGAIGLLGVVLVVRRRHVIASAVLIALVALSWVHLGIAGALSLGLVGSIVWMLVAWLLVLFWDRAIRDTERLADIQQAVSTWHATQQVRQRERRLRTQFALAVAGPVLSRVVATHGVLDEAERLEARLAEGRLRDELRGASLLNDAVRDAIDDARRRGIAVTVFDEGGLDGISDTRRAQIRDELAGVLADARASRVIIRAAHDERVAVTVVGRASSGSSRDDDEVDLWHEIEREPGAD